MPTRATVPVLLLALAAGCRSAAPPPRPSAPPPPPGATARAPTGAPAASPADAPTASTAPAGERLEIRWVRQAAEYEAAVRQAFLMAEDHVERAAAGRAAGTWGVVLDADETVIGNVAYQIERAGRPHEEEAWTAWVKRREEGELVQPGVPLVEIDGSLVTGGNRIGLWVSGGASRIRASPRKSVTCRPCSMRCQMMSRSPTPATVWAGPSAS